MKKKILILLITVMMGLSITGCDGSKDKVDRSEDNRFVDTGDKCKIGRTYSVYYDSKTKIVYLVATTGVTSMYNSEGKPMNIDEYNNTIKN